MIYRKPIVISLIFVPCLLIILLVASISVDTKNVSTDIIFNICREQNQQIWAHMGYSEKQWIGNSIETVEAAVSRGYCGVEIDVFYIAKTDSFILAHNIPGSEKISEATTLAQLFSALSSKETNYWLDFKNLDQRNAVAAAKRLITLIDKNSIKGRLFVESRNTRILADMNSAGMFNKIYWLQQSKLTARTILRELWQKYILSRSDARIVSRDSETIHSWFLYLFHDYAIFTFTINSEDDACRLFETGAQIVLSDILPPDLPARCHQYNN